MNKQAQCNDILGLHRSFEYANGSNVFSSLTGEKQLALVVAASRIVLQICILPQRCYRSQLLKGPSQQFH